VLDSEMLYTNRQWCWRKPSYAIRAHEWDFSFKPDTDRWMIRGTSR